MLVHFVRSHLRFHAQNIISLSPSDRLLSIDAFRGITITAMILVNNPGSWSYIYWPLAHAQWHGWTPTDLIFPFFLFLVGISISLSINQQSINQSSNVALVSKAFLRMVKLLLLGWFLALFFYDFTIPNYPWLQERLYSIRIMGVLQRIGIVYFICVLAFLFLSRRMFYLLAPGLLILYAALMSLVPYSDAEGMRYVGLLIEGNNFAAWIDNIVLTSDHVYKRTSEPFAYDPEGLLSTLPAIATCISGVATGECLRYAKTRNSTLSYQIKLLFISGLTLSMIGQLTHLVFPINKILWTPSYVLLSTGIALLFLAFCIYLIDHKRYKLWSAPFIVFGANAIAFFMFAGIVGRLMLMIPVGESTLKGFLFNEVFQPLFGNYNGSLTYAFCFLCLSYIVFHNLFKRRIIWKV